MKKSSSTVSISEKQHGWITKALQFCIVILSCVLAFLIRLFPNIINEPIIHEFDPHFNWRCSQYINQHGFYEFFGWYDNISWYPQGRPVGETSYPGLMFTSVLIKRGLEKIHIMVPLLQVCVHMGPIFAVLTVLLSFLFGVLIEGPSLGCLCSAMISFITGLISRSVAGSYDYECIALFILLLALYTFSYALKNGSILFSVIAGLSYGYMALTWGGYVFVSNCIPLFTVGLVVLGRYSWRLHIAYSIWAVVGTILTSQIPFIAEKTLHKPEHFAIILTFAGIQVWGFFTLIKKFFKPKTFNTVLVFSILSIPATVLVILTITISTGALDSFSGRLLLMFNPAYASKNVAIIASVAEHQLTTWSSYFMDCGFTLILFPLGCYFIIKDIKENKLNSEIKLLVLIFSISTLYFASVMVRLVLVFTPACIFVAAIGLHRALKIIVHGEGTIKYVSTATLFLICAFTLYHSVWFSCFSYSSDHIHFSVRAKSGNIESSDDYREGYRWLWDNTGINERVMSWWDYGYQITSMGGRGCMADGNTNNFTHIGIIGMTMSSHEDISWRLARLLGADYLLVIFGGASEYDGDDINKFLWMPKIANQTFTNISGDLYLRAGQQSLVGKEQTDNMTQSMMFKMCYYNFKDFEIFPRSRKFDLARREFITKGVDNIRFKYFEEAYTTKHWIMRIYKVLPDPLFDRVY